MLILPDAKLTVLAAPKTGSTAMQPGLQHRVDIAFRNGRKHVTARPWHPILRHSRIAAPCSSFWPANAGG